MKFWDRVIGNKNRKHRSRYCSFEGTEQLQEKRDYMKENNIESLRTALVQADAVVIGAGAGLSTSDFEKKYHFGDMYSGGFYPYDTLEEYWAYWSRYIYVNRYRNAPKPV